MDENFPEPFLLMSFGIIVAEHFGCIITVVISQMNVNTVV
jgi:hypothetical protein